MVGPYGRSSRAVGGAGRQDNAQGGVEKEKRFAKSGWPWMGASAPAHIGSPNVDVDMDGLGKYENTWNELRLARAPWDDQSRPRTNWTPLGRHGVTWDDLRRPGTT